MLFSSELAERRICFVSDGLQAELTESEITVHKDIARCITDWMYYACISDRRNVPDRVVKEL
jgi:hypothetical protein